MLPHLLRVDFQRIPIKITCSALCVIVLFQSDGEHWVTIWQGHVVLVAAVNQVIMLVLILVAGVVPLKIWELVVVVRH